MAMKPCLLLSVIVSFGLFCCPLTLLPPHAAEGRDGIGLVVGWLRVADKRGEIY
jgi:hypothetical protein